MPVRTNFTGKNDEKADALRRWYARFRTDRSLRLSDIAFRLNTLEIKWYVTRYKGIDNTATLYIASATYYGESKSSLWALRRAIQNAVDDFEPID